jgi:hypothetical protein
MKTPKFDSAKNETSFYKFNLFLIINLLVIILGIILQYTIPCDQKYFGSDSIISGIPLLRKWYLSIPFFLNCLVFIYYIIYFYNDKECYEYFNKSLLSFLKKFEGFKFFTNLSLFVFFYIIYHKFVHPIYKTYGFKISGHVTATLLSGSMLFNILSISENMHKHSVGKRNVNLFFYYLAAFIILHNAYSLIFTAWIYHHVRESALAFIIISLYLYIINFMRIDNIVLLALKPELPVMLEINSISNCSN